jgi:hypothetical protein
VDEILDHRVVFVVGADKADAELAMQAAATRARNCQQRLHVRQRHKLPPDQPLHVHRGLAGVKRCNFEKLLRLQRISQALEGLNALVCEGVGAAKVFLHDEPKVLEVL